MYRIMEMCYDSSSFTECKFNTKMKEPFKLDRGDLNFKELKVDFEIAKKPSDFEALATGLQKVAIPKDVIQNTIQMARLRVCRFVY